MGTLAAELDGDFREAGLERLPLRWGFEKRLQGPGDRDGLGFPLDEFLDDGLAGEDVDEADVFDFH